MELQQPGLLEVVGLGSNLVMSTLEVMPLTSNYQQSLHRSQWEASNIPCLTWIRRWIISPRKRRKYLQGPIPRVSNQTGMMLLGAEFLDGLQNGE